jgi:hypothetical protein
MSVTRWIGISIVGVFIIIQLIPSNRPEVIDNNPSDLISNNSIPDTVGILLKAACYDCHSNETKYPWYAHVAPVSWLVARDTRMGRENLNFSAWETYSKMDKARQLGDLAEEVEDGVMPMPIYILMHPEAKLTVEQREMLVDWSERFAESLFE